MSTKVLTNSTDTSSISNTKRENKLITREHVLNFMEKYKHSTQQNPLLSPSMCAYTDLVNPERHCIAGQFLAEYNLPIPTDTSSIRWYDPRQEVISDEALELLGKLQISADNHDQASGLSHPRKWKDAIQEVKRYVPTV